MVKLPNGEEMTGEELEERANKMTLEKIQDKFAKKNMDVKLEAKFYDDIWETYAENRKIKCIVCGQADIHFRMPFTLQERNKRLCDKCYQRRIGVRD